MFVSKQITKQKESSSDTQIVFRLERDVKLRLRRLHRRTRDKAFAQRCQLVLLISQGLTRPAVALAVGLSVSWVNRVFARFRDWGIAGLHDGREDNGNLKVDEWFCSPPRYKVLANWTVLRCTATAGPPGRRNFWSG